MSTGPEGGGGRRAAAGPEDGDGRHAAAGPEDAGGRHAAAGPEDAGGRHAAAGPAGHPTIEPTEPEAHGRPLERRGAGFWVSAAAGWAIIGWGIRGALHHHIDTRPRQLVDFFVGGALAHDLLFAPLVLIVGVLVARLVPGRWRAPVQTAAIISGCLALFAWPEIRDYAGVLHNPTSLPYNYTANVAILIAVVWVVVLGSAAIAGRLRRR